MLKVLAEKVIQPFIDSAIKGDNKSISYKAPNDKKTNKCSSCEASFFNLVNLRGHERSEHVIKRRKGSSRKSPPESPISKKLKVTSSGTDKLQSKAAKVNDKFVTIPENIKDLVDPEDIIFKVPGDGACGANALAAHIFGDVEYGKSLRKNMNLNLVRHWEHYSCIVPFPYRRKVGTNGKEVVFEKSEELLEYLQNHEEK